MSPTLASGLKVAHFRIEHLLGEGGMGEVYRAWDTKLDRAVALKILPPRLVADPSRLERFAREARSASALAHPNIVTIYEIGEAEVVSGEGGAGGESERAARTTDAHGTLHYIAMELVDGSTLRELVRDERTDLRTLLRVLGQAADGVAKAHEAGVVHRDLKPDNIMVTRDGFAKVLDFGLAKLDETVDPAGDLTRAATIEGEPTREGAVLGSVGYMSPEQVRGKVVDHRTDVFSFGCLLYEAATRQRPFGADSSVEIMHRILRDEPAPMEEVNPNVPGALRRLVKRCMAKDPIRRHQSMRDLALELGDLVAEFDSLAPASSAERAEVEAAIGADTGRSGRRRLSLAVGIVALAIVAGVWFFSGVWFLGVGKPGGATRKPAASPSQIQMRELTTTADVGEVALSPDGQYLAQARWRPAGTGLWITHLATGSSVEVLAPADSLDLRGVTFTPDGNYLVFVRNDPERHGYSSAFRIPVLGGEPERLIFDIDSAPSFSPDGRQMAFLRGAPQRGETHLMVADSEGQGAEILATTQRPEWFELTAPAWAPDGGTIYTISDTRGGLIETVVGIDTTTGRIDPSPMGETVFYDIDAVAVLPDGSALILTGRRGLERSQLWLVELPGGAARPLTQGLSAYDDVTVTADGRTIASRHETTRSQLWIAPADRPTEIKALTPNPRDLVGELAVSADGDVFFERNDATGQHIWRTSVDGDPAIRLTREGYWYGPEVSPDGSMLVARRRTAEGEPMELWRLDPETGELVERLVEDATNVWRVAIAPDASWMAVDVDDGDLWIYPMPGGEPKLVGHRLQVGRRLNGGPFVSSDGSTIAYLSFRTQVDGVSTQFVELVTPEGSAVGGLPVGRIHDADGSHTGFDPAGDSLIAHQFVDGVTNLWRIPLEGGEWTQLTDFDHGMQGYIRDVAFSPDGEWIVLSKGEYLSDAVILEGFR